MWDAGQVRPIPRQTEQFLVPRQSGQTAFLRMPLVLPLPLQVGQVPRALHFWQAAMGLLWAGAKRSATSL